MAKPKTAVERHVLNKRLLKDKNYQVFDFSVVQDVILSRVLLVI